MSEHPQRPTLLILSLSNISMDARVLKQVRLFAKTHRVTTCGFGPSPAPDVAHIELHADPSRLRSLMTDALIRGRMYRPAYWLGSTLRQAKGQLRRLRFDAVVANDLNTAMLALAVAPESRVHFDLHEYFPGLEDHRPSWVRHRKSYFEWQLRNYVSRGASSTTVSLPIAERYRSEFGFAPGVVLNASPGLAGEPVEPHNPLRFVYSGVAQAHRRIDLVMRAVAGASRGQTLDLYLTGEGTAAHDELLKLATELGPRIRLLPPVPQAELTQTLTQYDVGIPVLPLEPTNYALAMPNKLFDYVQARLAIVTGPNASMAQLVSEHNLGVISPDYELSTLVSVIDALQPEAVMQYKRSAHAVAELLSAETQNGAWREAIERIAPSNAGSGAHGADSDPRAHA